MRRDALGIKIAVMEALREPLILTHIMYKTHINCTVIKEELEYLIKKNLVTTPPKQPFRKYTKRSNSNHPHYVLTPEGTELLNSLLKTRAILMEPS